MNKKLLYSVLLLLLFAFSSNAQVGFTCAEAIQISSLPYQTIDDTANYGNNLAGPQLSTCIPGVVNYQSGNDVFYSYTATESGLISLILDPTQTRSSIFIYPNCEGITGACLAAIGNTTANTRFLNYTVVAGNTYIIVLSSNSQIPTYGYNFIIQRENCANVLTLSATNPTLNGIDLSWTIANQNALSYEVAVQPQGSLVPSGAGQYTSVTPNITLTDLVPATLYQYWVRTKCLDNSFSAWTGPFLFNTQICEPTNHCTYVFRMTDTANNGWNGARMQVRQNGIVLATIGSTYNSGAGPIDIPVTVCKDAPFDIFWSVAGNQPQQCIVSVLNSFGQTTATINGANSTVGNSIYTGIIDCDTPQCNLAPTNVTVNAITVSGGTINWDAPGTENVGFDVYIAQSGQPAPIIATVPTYSGVNGSAAPFIFTMPNILLPDTSYDVYTRVHCEPEPSPWSGVKTFTTLPTCPKPINQMVTGITLNSATLGWTEAASATQWEVLLLAAPNGVEPQAPLVTPVVGTNDIYIQNITGVTTTTAALQPATVYYYYVRSVCQPGDDKSTWTGPFIFNTITCNSSEKCTYNFVLTNTTSNSWNLGRMQVRQNGIVVAVLGTGGINNASGIAVALCNNVPFDLYWSEGGDLPEEMGISIIDVNNDIVFTKLPGQLAPLTVLYSDIILGNCAPSSCPKPTNLSAIVTATSAQLSWSETGSATQWEVYVAEAGMPQPVNGAPVSGTAPYYLSNENLYFTISNLLPSTNYTYYVRAICSSTDIGNWTILNSKTFNTIPLNDNCSAAINVPVNPTQVCALTVQGNTLGGTASAEISICPGNENDDVWFDFVATNNIHIVNILNVVESTTSFRFAIYSGMDCETMTQLVCSATNSNTALLTNLIVGSTYKIRVYTNGNNPNQSATFNVGIGTPPPPATNDECINAIPLTVNTLSECVYVTPGNLIGATASAGISDACIGIENDDVWFSFIATSTMNIINLLDVEGTTTNLNHSVFSGTCENLVQLYCVAGNTLSSNNANYIVGQTYYLRVWSNGSSSEVVTFNVCLKPLSNCVNAAPFCSSSPGAPYIFPNTTGVPSGTQVGCLDSVPNPTYYTINVNQSGPLNFTIFQNTNISPTGELLGTNLDVDFIAWGPFATPESCDEIVFASCPTCPNNTTNANFYPFGNIVDCSYSASFTETVSIPNAQAGEYYIILITNFNGAPGYISLFQNNADEPNAGQTSCGDIIQLVAFVDANNNGVKEETESNFAYGNFTFQKNNVGNTYYITNTSGVQNIFDSNTSNTYDFNYEINPEYASYYAETPTSFNDLSIQYGSGVQSLYFPITITQTYSDVDVAIIPTGVPRPGFTYNQKIVYRNSGIFTTSGTLNYTKGNASIVITENSIVPTTSTSNGFTFNYIDLGPGESRFINLKMTVPSIPTVNLGDLAASSVSITSVENDINVANNTFEISQLVVASYDPNDKNEARGSAIEFSQFSQEDYLFYTIRFQNTGTASAEFVRIEDNLASEFDFSSVRMISASHNYSMQRLNNKLIWTFNNINLPGAFQSEELSQGYVTFKIKLNAGFAIGDVIENTAEIYFDFNPAIITNTFQTTFMETLGVKGFTSTNILLYPNPANSMLYVNLQNTNESLKNIVIYDMIGKRVNTISGNNSQQVSINVGNLAKGVYMIEITTDSNLKQIRKFIVN